MAHLVILFVFTFYAVILANSKSVKIAENTFLKAKRQQFTLGKVVHCLFNINLYTRGGSRIFFRRGCTRLLLCFNTNKPHSFFGRIPVVLENRRSSQGGGDAHPLHPPPRSVPVYIVGDILLLKTVAYCKELIYQKADCVGSLWYKPRRNPRPRVYWYPGQYGGVDGSSIAHRVSQQCSSANLI